MHTNRKTVSLLAAALFSTAFAGAAAAQGTILVPAGPLVGGSPISVKYKDPSKAGETVHVAINDNGSNTTGVDIELDENGEGEVTWTLPSTWLWAVFTATGASSVLRAVQPPPPKN